MEKKNITEYMKERIENYKKNQKIKDKIVDKLKK